MLIEYTVEDEDEMEIQKKNLSVLYSHVYMNECAYLIIMG